ncbi:DUF6907 domain-containing protein [Pseudoclavibacter sp. 13-3]|uniref:DUF6907 domain-containing protein n=1 Tax=Pseudoclavibacter sp. 13-3 TaxID=2901228 RepID=UPI001E60ACBF|nr:hypothetical protein [Pseudoclavibacter sp. 13-3]MCD7101812.1 hypothetical protein [Pseudoclavibacter sp. 13-3]
MNEHDTPEPTSNDSSSTDASATSTPRPEHDRHARDLRLECPSWCVLGESHQHDLEVEMLHMSAMVPVPLVVRETLLTNGQVLSTPRGHECWVGLIQCGAAPYVTCSSDDGIGIDLTPESAQRMVEALALFLGVLRSP